MLEIFNFIFNPSEIYPIMIQSVFHCRASQNFANCSKRDMFNIIVKLILLIVVTAKNCSCDDDETSDIKGWKKVLVEVCLQFCCLKRSLIINTIRNQISLELLKLLMYKTGIPDTLDSINSHRKLTKYFDSFHSVLKAP